MTLLNEDASRNKQSVIDR